MSVRKGRGRRNSESASLDVGKNSSSDRIRSADLLSARLVARLLLSPLVAHDALIGSVAGSWFRPCCRSGLRLWHALLAAMFAALILHTFQIVFSGHAIAPFRGFLTPV